MRHSYRLGTRHDHEDVTCTRLTRELPDLPGIVRSGKGADQLQEVAQYNPRWERLGKCWRRGCDEARRVVELQQREVSHPPTVLPPVFSATGPGRLLVVHLRLFAWRSSRGHVHRLVSKPRVDPVRDDATATGKRKMLPVA